MPMTESGTGMQNGALGENLPFVFLGIPIVLLLINIILAIAMKKTGQRAVCDRISVESGEGQKEWYALDHCHDNHAVYLWTGCLGNHSLRD